MYCYWLFERTGRPTVYGEAVSVPLVNFEQARKIDREKERGILLIKFLFLLQREKRVGQVIEAWAFCSPRWREKEKKVWGEKNKDPFLPFSLSIRHLAPGCAFLRPLSIFLSVSLPFSLPSIVLSLKPMRKLLPAHKGIYKKTTLSTLTCRLLLFKIPLFPCLFSLSFCVSGVPTSLRCVSFMALLICASWLSYVQHLRWTNSLQKRLVKIALMIITKQPLYENARSIMPLIRHM